MAPRDDNILHTSTQSLPVITLNIYLFLYLLIVSPGLKPPHYINHIILAPFQVGMPRASQIKLTLKPHGEFQYIGNSCWLL